MQSVVIQRLKTCVFHYCGAVKLYDGNKNDIPSNVFIIFKGFKSISISKEYSTIAFLHSHQKLQKRPEQLNVGCKEVGEIEPVVNEFASLKRFQRSRTLKCKIGPTSHKYQQKNIEKLVGSEPLGASDDGQAASYFGVQKTVSSK